MRKIRTERRFFTAALLAAAWLSAAPLRAQPGPDRAQARAHFDRGVTLAKQQQYRDALAEFRLAYDAFPNHGVLYNIAQALILLDQPSAAIVTLERYLTEGGDQVDSRRRREVEASILRQREKTGTIALSVDPDGAMVTIDDEPIGRSPFNAPLRVDPGRHRVKAALDSGAEREVTLEVSAQQALSVRLEVSPVDARPAAPLPPTALPSPAAPLTPPPPARPSTPPPLSPAPPRARPADHATQRTLGYAIGAVGLALSGVALGHYLWNRGRYEDWQGRTNDYYRDPTDQSRESANDLARSIPAASAVTVGLFVGAGVALGTGTVLVVTSGSSRPSPTASGALLSMRGEF